MNLNLVSVQYILTVKVFIMLFNLPMILILIFSY